MDTIAVEAPAHAAASPDAEWTLVERPGERSPADLRASASSPQPELPASEHHEEQPEAPHSPESERLADTVLAEPFQAPPPPPQQQQLAAALPGPSVEEPSTPTASSGPFIGSCGNLGAAHDDVELAAATGGAAIRTPAAAAAAWGFDRQRERLRAASRLSGEGALEGFHDPQDLLLADATAPGASAQIGGAAAADQDAAEQAGQDGALVQLRWDCLAGGLLADLAREAEDARALLAAGARALRDCAAEGRVAMEEWAAALQAAARQLAKKLAHSSVPLWAMVSVSSLAALAVAALAVQVTTNRRLATQLRNRDRDLARLVVKILNLQDALQSAARAVPLIRHAPIERFTTTTTLIGMV